MKKFLLLTSLLAFSLARAASVAVSGSAGVYPLVIADGNEVTAISVKAGGALDILAYAGYATVRSTSDLATAQTVIPVDNAAGYVVANSRVVIGGRHVRTVSSATATNMTVSAATSAAIPDRAVIYVCRPALVRTVGADAAATNGFTIVGSPLLSVRDGFPLVITTSSTNSTLSVTAR